MLRVPAIRQPSEITCLPTCVRAALLFLGRSIPQEEAEDACGTGSRGTVVDVALDGLAGAGMDAELRQFASIDDLLGELSDGQPVIALIRHPSGSLHAVVVCDVTDDTVTIMDPGKGAYEGVPRQQFEDYRCRIQNEGLLVTGPAVDGGRGGPP